MKNKSSILIVLLTFLPVLFVSCELDEDDDPLADPRDKFIGTWILSEAEVKSVFRNFNIVITKDPLSSNQILISNFADINKHELIYGLVSYNSVEVPEQKILTVYVDGLGVLLSSTSMTWTYSVNSGADIINYRSTAIKK